MFMSMGLKELNSLVCRLHEGNKVHNQAVTSSQASDMHQQQSLFLLFG